MTSAMLHENRPVLNLVCPLTSVVWGLLNGKQSDRISRLIRETVGRSKQHQVCFLQYVGHRLTNCPLSLAMQGRVQLQNWFQIREYQTNFTPFPWRRVVHHQWFDWQAEERHSRCLFINTSEGWSPRQGYVQSCGAYWSRIGDLNSKFTPFGIDGFKAE